MYVTGKYFFLQKVIIFNLIFLVKQDFAFMLLRTFKIYTFLRTFIILVTYLSTLMATKLKIEADEQITSIDI